MDLVKLNFGIGNRSKEEAEQRRREWEAEKARKEQAKNTPEGSTEKPRPMRPSAVPPVAGDPEASIKKTSSRPSPFPRPFLLSTSDAADE